MSAPNQLVLKREKEGSAKLAVFFVALSAALVGTYAGIGVDKVLTHHYDFWFCVILGGLGWAFRSVGGNKPVIVAATLLSCFIMLTFYQAPLLRYLILAALLFAMGVYGMCRQRNAVRVLMSIELMLNAVNINLVAFWRYLTPDRSVGLVWATFVLTVAAAEAAVGLALVISVYRNRDSVIAEELDTLKN